jgi:Tfp pilus assembly protein PilO
LATDFRDPRILRFIVGLILLGALVFSYFSFFVSGVNEEIASREQTLDMKELELRELQGQTSDDLAMMGQRIEMFNQELEELDRFLPRSYDREEILQMLTEFAGGSGLQVVSLVPLAPTMDSTAGEYSVYNWQLTLTGRFHRLGVFFDQLTQQPMMSSISNLQIYQLKAAEGKFDNIETTFTFSAYVQP